MLWVDSSQGFAIWPRLPLQGAARGPYMMMLQAGLPFLGEGPRRQIRDEKPCSKCFDTS